MAIRPSACRSVSSAPPVPAHVREVASGATWMPLQSIKVSATPSQFICSNCNAVAGYSIQLASLSPTCNRWPKASNRAESRATTGPAPKRGLCDYSFKVAHYSFFDTFFDTRPTRAGVMRCGWASTPTEAHRFRQLCLNAGSCWAQFRLVSLIGFSTPEARRDLRWPAAA